MVLEGGRIDGGQGLTRRTFCPTATLTAVTCPDTAKDKFACAPGSIVPDAATVCFMVPVATVTRCVVTVNGEVDPELDVASRRPTVVPVTASTATTAIRSSRLRRRRGCLGGAASTITRGSVARLGGAGGAVGLLAMMPVEAGPYGPIPSRLKDHGGKSTG